MYLKEKYTINYWNGKAIFRKICGIVGRRKASWQVDYCGDLCKNEYRSYILIDFSKTTSNILECFDDIGNLNIFF